MIRCLIRTDGSFHAFASPLSSAQIRTHLQASELDYVHLRDGQHTMWVDDTSALRGLPCNPVATAIYMDKCGADHAEWRIFGNVIITPDSDFEYRRAGSPYQDPEPLTG